MPLTRCVLPDGDSGWKWGERGTCRRTRAEAERDSEDADRSADYTEHDAGAATMAMDPPVSEKQRRAMWAAAGGHSTLGIPKNVGSEFVGAQDAMALDRATARSYDQEGRLHVAVTNISKANVCPYIGREIPDWQALSLDADRIYQLLRDPGELARGAATFNRLPLLSRHVPVSALDHRPELIIGATGDRAEFQAPYLRNSLVVWSQDAIDGIENDAKSELSAAYRYRADMTPGAYQGVRYDGVMRDIRGNHVALVEDGRAGADVVVGDATPLEVRMKTRPLSRKAILVQGALTAALAPLLAQDKKPDISGLLVGVNAANYKARKPKIAAALRKLPLAQDADVAEVVQLLDKLEGEEPGVEPTPDDDDVGIDADPVEKLKTFLTGKMSDQDIASALALFDTEPKPAVVAPAAQDQPPTPGTPVPPATSTAPPLKGNAAVPQAAKEDKKPPPFAPAAKDGQPAAMDENSVKAAVAAGIASERRRQQAIREAEKVVRPFVGEIALACDSAEQVYRAALDQMGVKHEGIHESALRTILEMQPRPGSQSGRRPLAQDSAAVSDGFAKRFPAAPPLRVA